MLGDILENLVASILLSWRLLNVLVLHVDILFPKCVVYDVTNIIPIVKRIIYDVINIVPIVSSSTPKSKSLSSESFLVQSEVTSTPPSS
ncbi:hypothetical protein SLA2020_263150 [Shorea laevis]